VSAEVAKLRADIDDLRRQLGRQSLPPIGDRQKMIAEQTHWEPLYAACGDGDSARRAPLAGETEFAHKQRLIMGMQKHSPTYGHVDLAGCSASVLDGFAPLIYADVQAHVHDPSNFKPGELRPIVIRNGANMPITTYVGDPNHWNRFCGATRYAQKGMDSFLIPGKQR
jgi:hypothetical protein